MSTLLICLMAWLSASSNPTARLHPTITPLTDSIYIHTSYHLFDGKPFPSNGLIVRTSAGVVLVDTGWGVEQTRDILKWIRRNLRQKVVLCLVSHAHDDRIGGISVLRRKNIPVWSTGHTAEKAAVLGFPGARGLLPADTVLTVGQTQFQSFFPGAGHSVDNIVVWLPQARVLFGGCLVKSTEASGLGNLADANLREWGATIRRVQEKFPDAATVVPGHQAWGSAASLDHTLKLLAEHLAKN